ncbi:hypothetical protein COHA_001998 [Chlorella ohadii]|uniref:Apyrase n=1 Tax=Chlorella ohadii TaxID=2649997 RepID=A0AAD5DXZ5_9CHLO|nr:hypothetical protein COHA_001998 [Chlorella ohadii]
MEAWYRYRGVAAIVAIPVLLIATVLLVMPRSAPYPVHDFSRVQPFSRSQFEDAGAGASGGGSAGTARWAIVIDAGSTGSRVHIFKFLVGKGGRLELQFDKFDQLKPGLSSYADNPPAAAESLAPLLELAEKTIPKDAQKQTSIMVGATAGLRLLPDGKADEILAEVRTWLRKHPFKFSDEDVKILSGVDEGAFAWLTLNYLLGRLGGSEQDTVASIDLGGGSVQEAYAMTEAEAAAAPDKQYLTELRSGGKTYHVYVYSYLGYGLMAGRAAVLSEEETEANAQGHPCVPVGHQGTYEYAGKTMQMRPHAEGASHERCERVVLSALKHQAECGAPQLQCTFNGAWGGPRVPKVFYISSYFWDRATDAGLIEGADVQQLQLAPSHFGKLAAKACSTGLEELGAAFPKMADELRPFFCLDLSYAHTLLTKGFKIPDDAQITLVKRVEYNGELVEAAWPLGAALNALG